MRLKIHWGCALLLTGCAPLAIVNLFAVIVTLSGCGPVPAPKPPSPPVLRPIAVNFTQPITGVRVWFDGAGITTPQDATATGGRVGFPSFPRAGVDPSNVHIRADGYAPYDCVTHIPDGAYDFFLGDVDPSSANGYGQGWFVGANGSTCPRALTSLHVDPAGIPLGQLAAIRGAMWTSRLNLPFGPRPGQDSNILPMAFYDLYGSSDQARMLAHYHDELQYTHAVTGPITGNDCYHSLYPCRQGIPTQARWDAYLDEMQTWWDRGIAPVYFAKPDGWETPDHAADMDALDVLYAQPRAQQLIRIVVYPGWEPSGTKYGWPNSTYVTWVQRGARVFPNALRLLHTVSDLDAPTGGNDDKTFPAGQGNILSWRNVAPYIHGWLVQVGGYVDGGSPTPTASFLNEFSKLWADLHDKFTNGAAGWPTTSAWNDGRPLRVYYAEGASYGDFWKDWPESVAIDLGNRAMAAGADGYLDSGSVAVQTHSSPVSLDRATPEARPTHSFLPPRRDVGVVPGERVTPFAVGAPRVRVSPLGDSIDDVIALAPEEQVIRANARRRVAVVQNFEIDRNRPVRESPRLPVRTNGRSQPTDPAISILVGSTSPEPAHVGLFDERPEALNVGASSCFAGTRPRTVDARVDIRAMHEALAADRADGFSRHSEADYSPRAVVPTSAWCSTLAGFGSGGSIP